MSNNPKTGVQVKVIQWTDGREEIALHIYDLDQMVTFSAESARHLAFLLMECADHIEPPFVEPSPEENDESIALFGPYESEDSQEEDEDDDVDDLQEEN
jgi:hypothetical protein